MRGTIYRLLFSDGKYYIGSTINSMSDRFYFHKRDCQKGSTSNLYKHWRELNQIPKIEILEEVEITKLRDLHTLEKTYLEPVFYEDECLNTYKPTLTAIEKQEYNRQNSLRWRNEKSERLLE